MSGKAGLPQVALFALILCIWIYYPLWFEYALSLSDRKDVIAQLGTTGDAFGALNTLFSGLAFAGIIVSIALQSKELRDTRLELQGQKEQFVIQNSSLKRQVFENTFFQLLHLHNEVVGGINTTKGYGNNKHNLSGRPAISALFEMFVDGEHHSNFPGEEKPKSRVEDYDRFFKIYHDTIGHYFRNIYQILKFVDSSLIDDKRFYTNLLRAQLSSYELGLLFYNCLSGLGSEKFKPLIEKYSFLEHLPRYDLITSEEIQKYNLSAFGSAAVWAKP
ncbi:MAG: putative phage abortive infection protein [Rhodocyclaceae bacterium]|nr:putative phage abortive infection protein [Rhodocyclaceae bacterium]MBP7081079.1 putative phage abortive infection protein [Rhodocyclaceae bacterium]